jgi:uncharacterized protein
MTNRIEIKAQIAVDEAGTITGIAWPFGVGPDRVGDEIMPGAFKGAKVPLPMLYRHSDAVGAWTEIAETTKGLEVKGKLLVDDVVLAKEVAALVKAGAVGGLSVGFITKKASPRKGGGRTIKSLELVECSIVPVAMHPKARITSAKSAAAAIALVEALKRAAAQISKE